MFCAARYKANDLCGLFGDVLRLEVARCLSLALYNEAYALFYLAGSCYPGTFCQCSDQNCGHKRRRMGGRQHPRAKYRVNESMFQREGSIIFDD